MRNKEMKWLITNQIFSFKAKIHQFTAINHPQLLIHLNLIWALNKNNTPKLQFCHLRFLSSSNTIVKLKTVITQGPEKVCFVVCT